VTGKDVTWEEGGRGGKGWGRDRRAGGVAPACGWSAPPELEVGFAVDLFCAFWFDMGGTKVGST